MCDYHTFLRFEDGTIAVAGRNDSGQLGLGDRGDRERFATVPTTQRVAWLACGGSHTFLGYEDGTIATCGNNVHGQLGLGDHVSRDRFTLVPKR